MKCPYCGYSESKVIDSRPTDEGERIRRRRECLNCAKRFTTYEVIETVPVVVVKKDKLVLDLPNLFTNTDFIISFLDFITLQYFSLIKDSEPLCIAKYSF